MFDCGQRLALNGIHSLCNGAALTYYFRTVKPRDPEAERRRLAEYYASLTEGELRKIAEDPASLTRNAAIEALNSECRSKISRG